MRGLGRERWGVDFRGGSGKWGVAIRISMGKKWIGEVTVGE